MSNIREIAGVLKFDTEGSGGNVVNEEMGSTRSIHRMKAYSATVNSGKNVPQFII